MNKKLIPVYVALGKKIPDYLLDNIERHISLFPGYLPTIIVNESINFEKLKKFNIKIFEYKVDKDLDEILNGMNHDTFFRGGFWRFTLERIFALSQFQNLQNEALLHIESDVILLPNFPWEKFTSCKKLAWGIFSDTHDVAALLYSPNAYEIKDLCEYIKEMIKVNPDSTDMTLLSSYRIKSPEKVQVLASWPRNVNINSEKFNVIKPEQSSTSILWNEEFQGIFDPQALGMWLTGMDPRNNYGVTRIHSREIFDKKISLFDPTYEKYIIDEYGNIYIDSQSSLIPIYNLHVHSKNRKLFQNKKWRNEIHRLIELANQEKNVIKKFHFKILTLLIFENIKQKKILDYLYNHPFIASIVRKIRRN